MHFRQDTEFDGSLIRRFSNARVEVIVCHRLEYGMVAAGIGGMRQKRNHRVGPRNLPEDLDTPDVLFGMPTRLASQRLANSPKVAVEIRLLDSHWVLFFWVLGTG